MNQPIPDPIDPATLPELARGVIAADRFPCLATVDGQRPRLRRRRLARAQPLAARPSCAASRSARVP